MPEADDDLLRLDDLCESKLVEALTDRFESRRTFYTSVGTILIAINPYEWKPELYTKDVMQRYRDEKSDKLPPHLYIRSRQDTAAQEQQEATSLCNPVLHARLRRQLQGEAGGAHDREHGAPLARRA